jgi:hypothetical protein
VASDRIERADELVGLWNAGEYEKWLDEAGADFEFTPDPSFPDAGTYRGEEFRRWMRDWIATWQENRFELLGVEQAGDALLMRGRWHLATRQTGGEVPLEDFTLVLFYDDQDDERPARMAAFFDPEQAREAAQRGTG